MEAIIHTGAPAPPPELRTREPRRERAEPDERDHKLRDLVSFMARGLVDHPDDVAVEVLEAGDDGCFELQVHPDDLGHVIGKQGRTARSLRLALGAAAQKLGRRANLEIAD
ncbi:MAG: KH domain-containing protein [Candidatus Eiseniibacteriota bacterium]